MGYQPEDTNTSELSDEEVTGAKAAPAETFKSKSGNICWSSVPPDVHGRTAAANIIKMTPGITGFAVTRVKNINLCFDLFTPLSLKSHSCYDKPLKEKQKSMVICGMTFMRNTWMPALVFFSLLECTDPTMKLLIIFVMHQQAGKFSGQQCNFQMTSRVLRFDNRDTRVKLEKLIPNTDVWERWVQLLPLLFNPGPEVKR